ncbi:MAG: DUF6458 family protein [Acidimicrobiales bacterium]
MGIGVTVFLLAAGAILTFAVDVVVQGIDLDTVGIILMIVGGLGLLLFLVVWGGLSPYGRPYGRGPGRRRREETVIRDEPG